MKAPQILVVALVACLCLSACSQPVSYTHLDVYKRQSLVWASQGIYSKYEYLERIFFDAILHLSLIHI